MNITAKFKMTTTEVPSDKLCDLLATLGGECNYAQDDMAWVDFPSLEARDEWAEAALLEGTELVLS